MFFEADDLDHLTSNGTDYQINLEYRNFAINHLNQSFFPLRKNKKLCLSMKI